MDWLRREITLFSDRVRRMAVLRKVPLGHHSCAMSTSVESSCQQIGNLLIDEVVTRVRELKHVGSGPRPCGPRPRRALVRLSRECTAPMWADWAWPVPLLTTT